MAGLETDESKSGLSKIRLSIMRMSAEPVVILARKVHLNLGYVNKLKQWGSIDL